MLKPLGQVIKQDWKNSASAKRRQIIKSAEAAMVVETANKLLRKQFGSEITKQCRAVYYKNGVIAIACLASAAAQEIRLSEEAVIQNLNNFFGRNFIQKIRYLI